LRINSVGVVASRFINVVPKGHIYILEDTKNKLEPSSSLMDAFWKGGEKYFVSISIMGLRCSSVGEHLPSTCEALVQALALQKTQKIPWSIIHGEVIYMICGPLKGTWLVSLLKARA
jgi:hypothetical protein